MRLYLPLSLIGLVIVLITLWLSPIFKVGSWQITNSKWQIGCVTQAEISSDLARFKQNIFLIDADKIRDFFVKKYACIKDIDIKYQPLKNQMIEIINRQGLVRLASLPSNPALNLVELEATPSTSSAVPDYSFPNANDSSYLVADSEGVIFDTTTDIYLPLYYLSDPVLTIGLKLNSKTFADLYQIIQKLTDLNINFTQIKKVNNFFVVDSEPKLIFSTTNDLKVTLISLQLILNKSKIEPREIEMIDLRFNRPVVVYKEKKK